MPIIPEPVDPVKEEAAKRRRQKERALARLSSLAGKGVSLKRHAFFVPGWAGEEGKAWRGYDKPVLKGHGSIKNWIDRIVRTPDKVTYVSYVEFSEKESQVSRSFFEFAELLKARVRAEIKPDEAIDLIGHSMGGLDMVAAITQGKDPLLNVVNCVTVASPLQGIPYAGFVKRVDELLPWLEWKPWHHEQVKNMAHHSREIERINAHENRTVLLERVKAFYQLEGTQDMTVMRNARLRTDGLPDALKNKITQLVIEGATHSGAAGITHDPRTALFLTSILADIPIEKPKFNYGYVYVRKGS
jgi:triacylglycerol esterase/lipase EstA (alpha/beta hydrolase family)